MSYQLFLPSPWSPQEAGDQEEGPQEGHLRKAGVRHLEEDGRPEEDDRTKDHAAEEGGLSSTRGLSQISNPLRSGPAQDLKFEI